MNGVPVAVSRLGDNDSREGQNARAVKWLLAQPGGPVVVVTPRRNVESAGIKGLIAQQGVHHHAWRGFNGGHFDGQRVLYAWPDRQHPNDLWNSDADAIAVIEWGVEETAEWIEDVNPIQLFPGETVGELVAHGGQLSGLERVGVARATLVPSARRVSPSIAIAEGATMRSVRVIPGCVTRPPFTSRMKTVHASE